MVDAFRFPIREGNSVGVALRGHPSYSTVEIQTRGTTWVLFPFEKCGTTSVLFQLAKDERGWPRRATPTAVSPTGRTTPSTP